MSKKSIERSFEIANSLVYFMNKFEVEGFTIHTDRLKIEQDNFAMDVIVPQYWNKDKLINVFCHKSEKFGDGFYGLSTKYKGTNVDIRSFRKNGVDTLVTLQDLQSAQLSTSDNPREISGISQIKILYCPGLNINDFKNEVHIPERFLDKRDELLDKILLVLASEGSSTYSH